MHVTKKILSLALLASILVTAGCFHPGDRLPRVGDEIVACGQLFHTGTPIVLWLDPGGYDAYRARRHFQPADTMPAYPAAPGNPERYNTRFTMPDDLRDKVDREGWTLENLQQQVDLFVYHYDACGTSAQCFNVLQDLRGLSVQFMCDLDGTIYQTLDLKERAWHAGNVNCRCVGVEIANIGAYPDMTTLNKWYALDDKGWPYGIFPADFDKAIFRTPNFVPRPASKNVIKGTVNGRELMQYDFTNEQYNALTKLTATMARVFPKIKLQVPRETDGSVCTGVLPFEKLKAFQGFVGHEHLIKIKPDPGPAFNWDRIMNGAKRELGLW